MAGTSLPRERCRSSLTLTANEDLAPSSWPCGLQATLKAVWPVPWCRRPQADSDGWVAVGFRQGFCCASFRLQSPADVDGKTPDLHVSKDQHINHQFGKDELAGCLPSPACYMGTVRFVHVATGGRSVLVVNSKDGNGFRLRVDMCAVQLCLAWAVSSWERGLSSPESTGTWGEEGGG